MDFIIMQVPKMTGFAEVYLNCAPIVHTYLITMGVLVTGLVLAMAVMIRSQFKTASFLAIERIVVQQSTAMTANSTYSFQLPFGTAQVSAVGVGLCLTSVNVEGVVSSRLSYEISSTVLKTTELELEISVSHSSIIRWLAFTVVLPQTTSIGIVELLTPNLTFSNMNNTSRSKDYQTFLIPASFDLTEPSDFMMASFFSSITNRVGYEHNHQYFRQTLASIYNSSTLIYRFLSDHDKEDLFFSFQVTILLVKITQIYPPVYSKVLLIDSGPIPGQTSSVHSVRPPYLSPNDEFDFTLCIDGLMLYEAVSQQSLVKLEVSYEPSWVDVLLNGIFQFSLRIVCYVECADDSISVPSSSTDYICEKCTANSSTQFKSDSRTVCFEECSSYILSCRRCDNSTVCLECYNGDLVEGGCTDIQGCISVDQVDANTPQHSTVCTACSDNYNFDSASKSCTCKEGEFEVTGLCTSVTGCVAAEAVSDKVVCIQCNRLLDMTLNSSQLCTCVEDYFFNGAVCVEVCGDGRLYDYQCDDGNLDSGDGCDSQCLIESNYTCENGTNSSASRCYYTGAMSVAFNYIENTGSVNEGRLSLQLTPNLTALSSMDFTALCILKVKENMISIKDSTLSSSGQLLLVFDYDFTLENEQADLTVNFDPQYVRSQSQSFNFTAISEGIKLEYSDNQGLFETCKVIFRIVSLLVLVGFLLGSLVHPMLGIQLLLPFQVVYLLHWFTDDYTLPLSLFQQLSPTFGNFMFLLNNKNNLLLTEFMEQLEFDPLNRSVSLLTVSGLTVIFLIIKVCIIVINSKKNPLGQKIVLIVDRLLFSWLAGFSLVITTISVDYRAKEMSDSQSTQYFSSQWLVVGMVTVPQAIFLMFLRPNHKQVSIIFLNTPIKNLRIYSAFILASSAIFASTIISYSWSQHVPIYSETLLSCLVIMMLLQLSPFQGFQHKIGTILNIFVLFAFSLLMLLRLYFPTVSDLEVEILIVSAFIGLMATVLIVHTIRIISTFCSSTSQKQEKNTSSSKLNRLDPKYEVLSNNQPLKKLRQRKNSKSSASESPSKTPHQQTRFLSYLRPSSILSHRGLTSQLINSSIRQRERAMIAQVGTLDSHRIAHQEELI